MGQCEFCGVEEDLPFKCNYCNGIFCGDHRLPESHHCSKLWVAKMRRPEASNSSLRPGQLVTDRLKHTFSTEVGHLIIAWLALGVAFSLRYLLRRPSIFPVMFIITLGTAGLGFILHELVHKFAAKRFGCWAEFRIWPLGLTMALIFALVSGGSFIFAAPGATYIAPSRGRYMTALSRRENGIVSVVGPLINLGLAGLFFPLSNFNGIIGLVGSLGYQVNIWLAAFNLIPLGGMDGQKLLSWSVPGWLALTIPVWVTVALLFFL